MLMKVITQHKNNDSEFIDMRLTEITIGGFIILPVHRGDIRPGPYRQAIQCERCPCFRLKLFHQFMQRGFVFMAITPPFTKKRKRLHHFLRTGNIAVETGIILELGSVKTALFRQESQALLMQPIQIAGQLPVKLMTCEYMKNVVFHNE